MLHPAEYNKIKHLFRGKIVRSRKYTGLLHDGFLRFSGARPGAS